MIWQSYLYKLNIIITTNSAYTITLAPSQVYHLPGKKLGQWLSVIFLYLIGMDKTIQRGDLGKHGILFKIVPMHSEMKPSDNDFMSCWYKILPKWLPRAGQSVIPTNLSEFKVRKQN